MSSSLRWFPPETTSSSISRRAGCRRTGLIPRDDVPLGSVRAFAVGFEVRALTKRRWCGMHNLDLILTLTSGLAAALALGYVTHRLGLSPIVGYLLAGVAVGPNTPGFVANREFAA